MFNMMDSTKKQFEIDFLPVGEEGKKSGDCILLRFGDLDRGGEYQKVVIIDGGYQNNAEEVKKHLGNYYKCQDRNGRFVIDCMILSHPDLDHVSGLLALVQDDSVVIKDILMQRPWKKLRASSFKDGRITNHSIKERLKDSFEKAYKLHEATSNLKEYSVSQGREYSLGEAKITILGPSDNFYKQCIASCDKTPEPATSMKIFQNYVYQAKKNYIESTYYKGNIKWNH
jgi:mRNA degradation ribonuclease J1/J2